MWTYLVWEGVVARIYCDAFNSTLRGLTNSAYEHEGLQVSQFADQGMCSCKSVRRFVWYIWSVSPLDIDILQHNRLRSITITLLTQIQCLTSTHPRYPTQPTQLRQHHRNHDRQTRNTLLQQPSLQDHLPYQTCPSSPPHAPNARLDKVLRNLSRSTHGLRKRSSRLHDL